MIHEAKLLVEGHKIILYWWLAPGVAKIRPTPKRSAGSDTDLAVFAPEPIDEVLRAIRWQAKATIGEGP
jgi:hypothetical protein